MSHSTHVGFNAPPIAALSGKLFRRYWLGAPLFDASCVVGVGHIAAAVARLMPVLLRVVFAKSGPAADAFGVGHITFATDSSRLPPCLRRNRSPMFGVGYAVASFSLAVGVPKGNDPEPVPSVRRTNG